MAAAVPGVAVGEVRRAAVGCAGRGIAGDAVADGIAGGGAGDGGMAVSAKKWIS